MRKIFGLMICFLLSGCYVASGYDDYYYDDMQATYVVPSGGTYVEQGYASQTTTYVTPAATQSTVIYERTAPIVYIDNQPDIIYYDYPRPRYHATYFYPPHHHKPAPRHHAKPPHDKGGHHGGMKPPHQSPHKSAPHGGHKHK